MAITSSAKKAHRASLRRQVFNLRRLKAARAVVKRVRQLVAEKKVRETQALLAQAYQAIDKGVKRNVWNKGAAARKKSRLARLVAKMV